MGTKGTLLTFRPDIKVVDATLRDGGLVNNFRFTDEFVKVRRNSVMRNPSERLSAITTAI